MKTLNEALKTGNLKSVYLFYGQEAYLRRQYRDKLIRALHHGEEPEELLAGYGRNHNSMNYHYFEGKTVTAAEIIDLAETLPFFAERRLIVWENSGLFKAADEVIAKYVQTMPETTTLLFVEEEVDKRGKMFKLLQGMGGAVEFPEQDESTLTRWIAAVLSREGKRITERGALYLLGKTGTEMDNIRGELEKLICFCLDRDVVTEDDMDAVCVTRISNHIFDMVSAIADKKQQQALHLYYDLLALKEPPMRILFLIARQFNMLMQVKELKRGGYDNKSIGAKVGLPGFIAGKYAAQAGKFGDADLREAVAACVEAEEAVKTGRMNDRLSVELIIVRYSV